MIAMTENLKRVCKEYWLIENYEQALNDKEENWVCHHRREIQDDFQIWTRDELIKVGQYYHRPANELIFLKQSEHRSLHESAIDPHTKRPISEKFLGRKFSTETRKKLSIANKGKEVSAETRKKLSIAAKGRKHNEETRKKMSIAAKGRKHNEETRKKLSISNSKISKWLENFGYTLTELKTLLPLTEWQIRCKAKHYPDELKKIISETIGG